MNIGSYQKALLPASRKCFANTLSLTSVSPLTFSLCFFGAVAKVFKMQKLLYEIADLMPIISKIRIYMSF